MHQLNQITIIGAGLIGGSLGLSMKRKGLCKKVVGVDEFSVIHRAKERHIIDEGFIPDDLGSAVKGSELIFICTPIHHILDIIPKLSEHAEDGTIICDVGSTKRQIVLEAAQHVSRQKVYFLGSHPMAGSEFKGVEAADDYLFENVVWVLTPYQKIPDAHIRKVGTLLEQLGAKVLLLSPELHDKIAAAVSHLPQMAAIALTNLIARHRSENPNYIRLAAGGFRDMTRIASSPYSVWKDICRTNKEQIAEFIDEYINELSTLKEKILTQNIADDFEKANITRLAIPKDTKGFLKPTYDISVGVEDKPGVIAQISTVLAAGNINIKDIEVLKVREGEGGTIRLSFETDDDRLRAIEQIKNIGFTCYLRD